MADFTIDDVLEETDRNKKIITVGTLNYYDDLVYDREDKKDAQTLNKAKEFAQQCADSKVLSDTTENWNKQRTLIAKKDTIYYYTDKQAMKVGDGTSYLIDMPFVPKSTLDVQDEVVNETLIFTR